MNITKFDKMLFKSKNNTKHRDFAAETVDMLKKKCLLEKENAALKTFDRIISKVYSGAKDQNAETLTYPPANTDVFSAFRGKFLKPKGLETDYFAELGEAYEKEKDLNKMPWEFPKLFKEYETVVNGFSKPENRFILFIKPFGLSIIAAFIMIVGYQLTQWTRCPIPFLGLFGMIAMFGGAIATAILLFYALIMLITGDDYNNYPALTKSYLELMRYLRIRALWYQSASGTDKVPDYIADAEIKVQQLAEKWMKKIKKQSGVKYNKVPDEKVSGEALSTAFVSLLPENERKKKYLPLEYKGFNIKGAEYEAKLNYDKAFEFYMKAAECGNIDYFFDALRVAVTEKYDGSYDFWKIHSCCLLYDELGHPNDDKTMLDVYSVMTDYCDELKDNAIKTVLKAMGRDPKSKLSPLDYMNISKKHDVLEAIKMGGFYHTKLALYGTELIKYSSRKWLITELIDIAETGKDVEEACYWIEKDDEAKNIKNIEDESLKEAYEANAKKIKSYHELLLMSVIKELLDKEKKNEAKKALLAMANVNMPDAMTGLVNLFIEDKNYIEALKWAEKAKESGFNSNIINMDEYIGKLKKLVSSKK